MKTLILFGLISFFTCPLFSEGTRRFTVTAEMLTDSELSEIISYILNESFDDLWRDKADLDEDNFLGRRYTILDLFDEEKTDVNVTALNSNFDDLWASKADEGTAVYGRRYTVTDITNPEKAEENAFAINENFDDLYRFKKDR